MKIEIISEDEVNAAIEKTLAALLTPKLVGFCIGVPGVPCGRKIYDDEMEAVQLEPRFNPKIKNPIIGKCCYVKLFPLVAIKPQTASQHTALKKKAGKASARVANNRLAIKPENGNRGKPRPRRGRHPKSVGIALPGSTVFIDKKPETGGDDARAE